MNEGAAHETKVDQEIMKWWYWFIYKSIFLTLTIGQGPQLRTIAVYVHEEVYQIWLKWVCELAVFQTSSLPLLNWPRRFPRNHLYALEKKLILLESFVANWHVHWQEPTDSDMYLLFYCINARW